MRKAGSEIKINNILGSCKLNEFRFIDFAVVLGFSYHYCGYELSELLVRDTHCSDLVDTFVVV